MKITITEDNETTTIEQDSDGCVSIETIEEETKENNEDSSN